jgi:hypothetical protein
MKPACDATKETACLIISMNDFFNAGPENIFPSLYPSSNA